jgi:2-dehydro-3-deoxyphosphooctonate aldolase (KDO 8-P synthase)
MTWRKYGYAVKNRQVFGQSVDIDSMKAMKVGDDTVGEVTIAAGQPLAFIGGPCAIENEAHTLMMAEKLKAISDRLGMPFIFKACYDKDCRSSMDSFLGIGLEEGLRILQKVRNEIGVPITSDVSSADWVEPTAQVVDLLQIPAYLCRQTHLLLAAGNSGKPINIKKGQFMSPWNMKNSARKIESTGNSQIILSERGTFFGYNMLINDFRSFKIMQDIGYPACYDATHSVQLPTSLGVISGGQREFIPSLVRSAAAAGIEALFMEVHDDPANALSDSGTQLHLQYAERVLSEAKAMHETRLELKEKWGDEDIE